MPSNTECEIGNGKKYVFFLQIKASRKLAQKTEEKIRKIKIVKEILFRQFE